MNDPPKQDNTLLIALLVALGIGGVGMSCICCGGAVWYLGASSTRRLEQMKAEQARKMAESRERLGMDPQDPFGADHHRQLVEESRRRHEQMMQEMAERQRLRQDELQRQMEAARQRHEEMSRQHRELRERSTPLEAQSDF